VADGAGPPRKGPPQERRPPKGRPQALLIIGRILRQRVPLWLVLVGAVVVVIVLLTDLLAADRVDLGPAVDGAVNAELSLTVCNEVVDRRQFNPRTAELAAEDGLLGLGVEQVKVALARVDCGPEAPEG
jgi:hypothetical protein